MRFTAAEPQSFTSAGGDPAVAQAFDPIAGGGACATTDGADEAGTANYRLPPAGGAGFTLMGAPTVQADMAVTGEFPEVAARLLDVGPDGKQTLVARTVYRPDTEQPRQVFQLHPNGWHFAAEHVPEAPAARARRAVRAGVERPVLGRGVEPRAAPARARDAGHRAGGEAAAGGAAAGAGGGAGRRPDRAARGLGREAGHDDDGGEGREARLRLRLRATCRRVVLRGRDKAKVKRLVVRRRGMRRRVDRRRPFRVALRGGTARRVRAVAVLKGGKRVRLRATVPKSLREAAPLRAPPALLFPYRL